LALEFNFWLTNVIISYFILTFFHQYLLGSNCFRYCWCRHP